MYVCIEKYESMEGGQPLPLLLRNFSAPGATSDKAITHLLLRFLEGVGEKAGPL